MKNMRLKLARVEMNLSQEELAAKVNVTVFSFVFGYVKYLTKH